MRRIIAVFIGLMLVFPFLTSCSGLGNGAVSFDDSAAAGVENSGSSDIAEVVTVEDDVAGGDIDQFIGTWEDLSDAERYAIIQKTEDTYTYQDNEGTYPASIKDDTLQIDVGIPDSMAVASIDAATGNLVVVFQEVETRFSKKQ